MYLVDTNIVSLLDARKRANHREVAEWLDQNGAELFLSVISLTEIEYGVMKLRREQKHQRAREIETLFLSIVSEFGDRLLSVDTQIAITIPTLAERIRPRVVELTEHFANCGVPVVNS